MAEHNVTWPRSFRDAVELPADQVGTLVEALIAVLDARDGDSDLEENGLEDGFVNLKASGPGCPIADPGGSDDQFEGSYAALFAPLYGVDQRRPADLYNPPMMGRHI